VDAQLNEAVRKQDARALLNIFGQRLEGGAHQAGRAANLARRNHQLLASLQQH